MFAMFTVITNKMLTTLLTAIALNVITVTNAAYVEVSDDGPAVRDIPIKFNAILKGDVPVVNQFVYYFEDNTVGETLRRTYDEIVSGRTANLQYVFSKSKPAKYIMNVQVYAYIWGYKGWFIAQVDHTFEIRDSPLININISQSGVKWKALSDNIVCTNRTVNLTAIILGSQLFRKSANAYTWFIDDHSYKPSDIPYLSVNFTENKVYKVGVNVMVKIFEPNVNKTIVKTGTSSLRLTANNGINNVSVNGNTWLLHGALLQLDVNCTGGTPPFAYCWDIFLTDQHNYSCSDHDLINIENCSFTIMHYFPKANIYYVEIGVENDIDFVHKNIIVHVYESTRRSQLTFVIIPVVSSILAIIIVVVGIAYHLQQRQRYNITLEVADFDFQRTEDLNEKTFFERLRESFSTSMRVTLMHPCLSAQNYEDLIDDHCISPQIPANNNTDSVVSQSIDTNINITNNDCKKY